jgi:hypothetical protein
MIEELFYKIEDRQYDFVAVTNIALISVVY